MIKFSIWTGDSIAKSVKDIVNKVFDELNAHDFITSTRVGEGVRLQIITSELRIVRTILERLSRFTNTNRNHTLGLIFSFGDKTYYSVNDLYSAVIEESLTAETETEQS